MLKLGWGGGAVADYPWHLDGSRPWTADQTINSFEVLGSLGRLGIHFVDTAQRYGGGVSEKIIGAAKKSGILKDSLIITKGEVWTSVYDMEKLFSISCEKFGDRPAGFLFHNPDLSRGFARSHFNAAAKWLSEKKLCFDGISTEPSREAVELINDYGMNCIQFPYSKWDRRAEDEVFPFIKESVMVIINRMLGGPEIEKSKEKVDEAVMFIKDSRARINVALVGTTNKEHLEYISGGFNGD